MDPGSDEVRGRRRSCGGLCKVSKYIGLVSMLSLVETRHDAKCKGEGEGRKE